ncbi:MAG: hypothetical protein MN733_20495 [Nitrososphaera sp.]|nr:hypothetical protein [Nitrososphaera sp.]
MRLFRKATEEFEDELHGECAHCRWEVSFVYVLAEDSEDATRLIQNGEAGLCGDCMGDLLSELDYDITRVSRSS